MEIDLPHQLTDQAEIVVNLAAEHGMTLATVESCTAGELAHLLSQAEGASKVLHGGFIVYTKDNKTAAVGVSKELLAEHTAVSAAVAKAMALGGLARCPASIVAAITGVAGPEPDEDHNPVGLVYVAAAARDGRCLVAKHEFVAAGKALICAQAMQAALSLVEQLLRPPAGDGR